MDDDMPVELIGLDLTRKDMYVVSLKTMFKTDEKGNPLCPICNVALPNHQILSEHLRTTPCGKELLVFFGKKVKEEMKNG